MFDREFAIGVRLALPADLPPGEVTVPARLRYQACDDKMCYAPSNAQASVDAEGGCRRTRMCRAQHGDVLRRIAFGTGETPARPPPYGCSRPHRSAGGPGRRHRAARPVHSSSPAPGGYLGTGDFLTFIKNAETGVVEKGLFEGQGPLAILLIVFLGGLALNLTPCVLPMIPINLAIIGAGAQAGSRRRGFLLGLTYGGAMAFVYGVLGLIVVLTASTFGTINASPWFNLGIAVLFVALALAMFDVFEIDFSRFSGQHRQRRRAAARSCWRSPWAPWRRCSPARASRPSSSRWCCSRATSMRPARRIALALPFFLGIGMAMPWPIAGAGLASLPKPGPWMVRVKQAFGVLILGTAVYYGYLAYELFSSRWVDATEVASSVEEKLKEGWHSSLAEGLAVAEREGKPVLVDMWATWCKNCLTMDKTTLVDPVGEAGAGRLREGEVPGRAAGRSAGGGRDEAVQGRRAARVRDPEAGRNLGARRVNAFALAP